MKFGKSLLSPSYSRKPHFDSGVLEEDFTFKCVNCSAEIALNPSFLIGKEFAWHDDFDTPSHEAIKTFFDMNGVGKAPDGGRTAVNTTYCPQCNSSYIVYAGVNEYYNSLYKITLQGIVEVLDEQY